MLTALFCHYLDTSKDFLRNQDTHCFFQFYGTFRFKFQLSDLSDLLASGGLEDVEVTVTAQVGDMIWNVMQNGYSKTRLLDSNLRLRFLGDSPHVLRPAMPFKFFVSFNLTVNYQRHFLIPLSTCIRPPIHFI